MGDLKQIPDGLAKSLPRDHVRYLSEIRNRVNEKLDAASGLTGTYTFGGGSPGDVASMRFVNGLLVEVTTV